MNESLIEAIERCRRGEGSLFDYKAAFEFADDCLSVSKLAKGSVAAPKGKDKLPPSSK